MNAKNKSYLSLIVWVAALVLIGAIIGSLTKADISDWYKHLSRSPLTPPNYIFPIAWTILYGIIGACGWLIWCKEHFPGGMLIKGLYIIQLGLNWMWSFLFFRYHWICVSLIDLVLMDIVVGMIIYLGYVRARLVSLLMLPYLLWIVFATYLNFYILYYN